MSMMKPAIHGTPDPNLLAILRDLVRDVHDDVERFAFDRAYFVAGGPLLTVANRLGWPTMDVFLVYVLAVRALAHVNRGGVLDYPSAMGNYERQHATVTKWLDPVPVTE